MANFDTLGILIPLNVLIIEVLDLLLGCLIYAMKSTLMNSPMVLHQHARVVARPSLVGVWAILEALSVW